MRFPTRVLLALLAAACLTAGTVTPTPAEAAMPAPRSVDILPAPDSTPAEAEVPTLPEGEFAPDPATTVKQRQLASEPHFDPAGVDVDAF